MSEPSNTSTEINLLKELQEARRASVDASPLGDTTASEVFNSEFIGRLAHRCSMTPEGRIAWMVALEGTVGR